MAYNVPNVDGVPSIAFAGAFATGLNLLTSDLLGGFGGVSAQWGIFLNGAAVVTANNVMGVEYRAEWAISDFPVEEGGFESFDKVQLPFDVRVRFCSDGTPAGRAALLNSLDAIDGDLNLYDVVTPEFVYSSVNIAHVDYRRTAQNGVGIIQAEVWLLRVNVNTQSGVTTASISPNGTATPAASSATSEATSGPGSFPGGPSIPGAAPQTNDGTVQATNSTALITSH